MNIHVYVINYSLIYFTRRQKSFEEVIVILRRVNLRHIWHIVLNHLSTIGVQLAKLHSGNAVRHNGYKT